GWMRWGWPERVGGLGGSPLLRAYLGEALTSRDLVEPGIYSMTEVLAPTMIDFAAPELAATMVPRLLRGDETWCQGFSEPGTGSNLASLTCRAVRTDDGWRVSSPYDCSTTLRHLSSSLILRRQRLLDAAPPDSIDPGDVGEVAQLLYAFRARSRSTQHRLANGERLGPETSIDKELLATTEQA